MKIRELIGRIVGRLFGLKAITDVGFHAVSMISGKLPEIMGAIFLFEKATGFKIEGALIGYLAILFLALIYIVGKLYTFLGFYGKEMVAIAKLNPVAKEQYDAALKINLIYKDIEVLKK